MDMEWPIPESRTLRLDWRGDTFSYSRYPFAEILDEFRDGKGIAWQDRLQNRIIILGTTASGLHDIRHTPISGLHPGVEILATAIDNLKNEKQLYETGIIPPLVLLIGMVGGVGFAFARRWQLLYTGLGLGCTAVLLLFISRYAVDQSLLLPVLTPLLFAGLCFFALAMHAYFGEVHPRPPSQLILEGVKTLAPRRDKSKAITGVDKRRVVVGDVCTDTS